MGTSVLHIKTEVECRVYLFDEEKGIVKPGTYFNLEVRKGEQDLLFVSINDENMRCQLLYYVEKNDSDYIMVIEQAQFVHYSQEILEEMQKAEQGDFETQYQLGQRYFYGVGLKKDYAESVKWYRMAAKHGNAKAQFSLGLCYYNGQGVEIDYKEAVKWYSESAMQKNVNAQCNLGVCFYYGRGVEKDYVEAMKCWAKSAEKGSILSQQNLDKCSINVEIMNQVYKKAVKWFDMHKSPRALCSIGMCYLNGKGVVVQDFKEAVKWFYKAAEIGYAEAQCYLGWCYVNGKGVEQDSEQAIGWFKKAAAQGCAKAQYFIGQCYMRASGIIHDRVEALKWFREAAAHGYATAQYILGHFYYNGAEVDQSNEEALKWWRESAANGSDIAQLHLGECYKDGKCVDQNLEEAVKWFHKAANQGNTTAMGQLRLCYKNGLGVKQDDKESVKWENKLCETMNEWTESGQFNLSLSNIGCDGFEQDYKKAVIWFLKSAEIKTISSYYYIFIDTETTGVPIDYNAPASNTRNWPRLVQLGWIVTDEEGNVLSQGNEIVKPEGFVIPADAAQVHGITTEKAQRDGKPLREVIEAFLKDARQTKCFVGHNISFDQKVVGAELYRLGIPDTISTAKSRCTMQEGKDFCKIPGSYGYKWPKLQELYRKLFGCDFEDAHDAMADITATKKCFFEILKRNATVDTVAQTAKNKGIINWSLFAETDPTKLA